MGAPPNQRTRRHFRRGIRIVDGGLPRTPHPLKQAGQDLGMGLRSDVNILLAAPMLALTTLLGSCTLRGAPVDLETFCPGGSSPDPDVVMCENFEDGDFKS